MDSTMQVSIGGAGHAGGEWLLRRRWAGWDGRANGGGHSTLLPRCLLNKRLHSLFMEFDLTLGVGVGWLGVWGVGGVLLLMEEGEVRRKRKVPQVVVGQLHLHVLEMQRQGCGEVGERGRF